MDKSSSSSKPTQPSSSSSSSSRRSLQLLNPSASPYVSISNHSTTTHHQNKNPNNQNIFFSKNQPSSFINNLNPITINNSTNNKNNNSNLSTSQHTLKTLSGGRYYDEYDEDEESELSIINNHIQPSPAPSPSRQSPTTIISSKTSSASPYHSCFPPIPTPNHPSSSSPSSSSYQAQPNLHSSPRTLSAINQPNHQSNNLHPRSINLNRTTSSTSSSCIIDLSPSSNTTKNSSHNHHHHHRHQSTPIPSNHSQPRSQPINSHPAFSPSPNPLLSSSQSSSTTTSSVSSSPLWLDLLGDRPILRTFVSLGSLLIGSAILVGAAVYAFLPPVAEDDLSTLRIPTSFEDLKKLNVLLQVYKTENYYRVLTSFVLIYLFLQAFSLPGSMYLSILAGAMFGVSVGLPLVCLCVGTGAMLCYMISYRFAGPLFEYFPSLGSRLDAWRINLSTKTNRMDLFAYLVVIRISPLPPHWVVNLLAPHVGIPLGLFWMTTCLGILPVTLIHTQLGTTLDQMVGPEDLSLLNTKNLTGLALVAIGVMVPVGIRWYVSKTRQDLVLDSIVVESRTRPGATIGLNFKRVGPTDKVDGEDEEEEEDDEDEEDDDEYLEGDDCGREIRRSLKDRRKPRIIKRLANGQTYQRLASSSSTTIPTLKRAQDSEETLILCDRNQIVRRRSSLSPIGRQSEEHQRGQGNDDGLNCGSRDGENHSYRKNQTRRSNVGPKLNPLRISSNEMRSEDERLGIELKTENHHHRLATVSDRLDDGNNDGESKKNRQRVSKSNGSSNNLKKKGSGIGDDKILI